MVVLQSEPIVLHISTLDLLVLRLHSSQQEDRQTLKHNTSQSEARNQPKVRSVMSFKTKTSFVAHIPQMVHV